MKDKEIYNTKQKGVFKFVAYPEGNIFVGVCLTLNIIEEGKNPQKLLESLKNAAFDHLEVVRKENLSDDLLNRHAPKKYWDQYYTVYFLNNVKKILLKGSLSQIPVKQDLIYV